MSINYDAPFFYYTALAIGVLSGGVALVGIVRLVWVSVRWRRKSQRWKNKPTGRPRNFSRDVSTRWSKKHPGKKHATSRYVRPASHK
jgi:hypothetical protein